MKKNLLFSATLLCSALLCSNMFADQEAISTEADEIQKSMELVYSTYQEASKYYDSKTIAESEANISNALKSYMLNCSKDKSYAKNTDSVEQEVAKIVEVLAATTNEGAALSITSLMFTIEFTKTVEQIEVEITDTTSIENLSDAYEEINKFMTRFFFLPLQEIFAQQQVEQPAEQQVVA